MKKNLSFLKKNKDQQVTTLRTQELNAKNCITEYCTNYPKSMRKIKKRKLLKLILLFTLIMFLSCKIDKKETEKTVYKSDIKFSIENNKEYLELGKSVEVILHSKDLGKRLLKITTRGKTSYSNAYSNEKGFFLTINATKENIKDGFYEMYLTEVLRNNDTIEKTVRIPVKMK
mgnify:CR=1 FL=1